MGTLWLLFQRYIQSVAVNSKLFHTDLSYKWICLPLICIYAVRKSSVHFWFHPLLFVNTVDEKKDNKNTRWLFSLHPYCSDLVPLAPSCCQKSSVLLERCQFKGERMVLINHFTSLQFLTLVTLMPRGPQKSCGVAGTHVPLRFCFTLTPYPLPKLNGFNR